MIKVLGSLYIFNILQLQYQINNAFKNNHQKLITPLWGMCKLHGHASVKNIYFYGYTTTTSVTLKI